MKSLNVLFTTIIIFLLTGCSKEVVLLNKYEKNILNNTFMTALPQLQFQNECRLYEKNKIKTISFVVQHFDSFKLDSLTFVELKRNGQIIRKTTTDNVGLGCLPYMHRQKFLYKNNKIIKILDYTFKYKANSILEQWMLKDTSKLILFDWEDYSYNGDTITVESGGIIWKYIKAPNGNIIKQIIHAKSNNQLVDFNYKYSGPSIVTQMNTKTYSANIITKYIVKKTLVSESTMRNQDKYLEKYKYDSRGLLKYKDDYLNGELKTRTIVTYSYY